MTSKGKVFPDCPYSKGGAHDRVDHGGFRGSTRMTSYMYPAHAKEANEWVRGTLNKWEESRKLYLCFPYARDPEKTNFPEYLVKHADGRPFWLYMYYLMPFPGNNFAMGGQVKFRIRVLALRSETYKPPPPNKGIYNCSNVHFIRDFDENMEVTLRFICDRFEEICLMDDEPMRIENFRHPDGKDLPALMENQFVGIPPVECREEKRIKVVRRYYPQGG